MTALRRCARARADDASTRNATAFRQRSGAVSLSRRALLGGLAALAAGSWARPALAGSYLNRAALLLHQGRRESDALRSQFGDKELALLIQKMAAARLNAAGTMLVPKEVVQAHPHLLLVFENYERAADAAIKGQAQRFLVYSQRAQDEERTFRAVLKQHGWELKDKNNKDRSG